VLTTVPSLLAAIPSPSRNHIDIGPLTIHFYGVCIALGVVAAVVISSKRWERRGGDPDDIATIALWAVPAGVIGARAYHVATDWKTYEHNWVGALKITQGGLGIPGGILFGVLAGLVVVRYKKLPALDLLDVVAPALPVAQAIGRLGNWFNQELYGRPTKLPWGLHIDNPPAKYAGYHTFQPTFLYEAIWNLCLAGFLIWLDKKRVLRRGELFALYVLGYSLGRLWVESLRSDPASLIFGIRVNIWMSCIVAVVTAAVMIRNRLRDAPIAGMIEGAESEGYGSEELDAADDADSADPGDAVDTGDSADTADT